MNQTRRYPGSRPFADNPIERLLFRGRDKEKAELLNLILAYDLVLLYARSGTGKTSLINAGILHDLRLSEFFPAAVRLNSDNPLESAREAILAEAARFGIQVEQGGGTSLNLVLLLSKGRFWRGDVLLTPVIILDQFEELFTLHEQSAQVEIIEALSDLTARRLPDQIEGETKQIPTMPYKLVFSVREDYLGEMESVAARIPTIMHHRFRLTQLSQEQARKAIREPAAMKNDKLNGPPFTYADEAIDMLVDFLSRRRDRQGYCQGIDVEPFQLQIICQHIEDKVSKRSAETGPIVIYKDDLGGPEGMEQVLEQFYNDQIDQLPEETREWAHRLCENGLISQTGKRISLEEDYIGSEFGVDPSTLIKLIELRLLRAEPRVGSTYYELSHDTLVGAVERTGAERRPAILLEQARSSAEDQNFSMALRYYIELINLTPKESTAYVECAMMLMKHGLLEDAEKVLEMAKERELSDAKVHMARGELRLLQERPKDGISEFKKALRDNSVSARAYSGMGRAYLKDDDSRSAKECYRNAVELDQNLQEAHEGLLVAMVNMHQFDDVKKHMALLRHQEFYILILPRVAKWLYDVRASMISREILKDELSGAGDKIDLVETIAECAFSIEEWEIALAALETIFRIDPERPLYNFRAKALKGLNRFEEAVGLYTLALQQNPEDANPLLDLAICRTILQRYDEAIEDCKRAVEHAPTSALPLKYWACCLHRQGKHNEAIEKFEKADRLEPGDSQLLTLWAENLNDMRSYEEAATKAREAIKADQTNANAFCQLGHSLWLSNRLSEANDEFQAANELDPKDADILTSWGVLLSTMQRHDDAIDKFERSNRLNSKNPYTLWNWGKSLRDSGRYQDAVEKCRQALGLEPRNADAHHNLALSLAALDELDDAVEHFQQAAELAPNDALIRGSWANALIKKAKYAEGEEQYRHAVRLATDDDSLISVYGDWGYSLGRMGRHKEAEEKYRKALEIKTDIGLLCGVASQLVDQSRVEQARGFYLRAEGLGPKDSSELGNLGWGFYQLGDYDKSLHYSRRAVELEPDALYARCNVGLALLRLGRPDEAKKEYERAIQIAERTTDASEFHYHAVQDVEEAMKNAPDLPGGRVVLQSLRRHLERIQKLRTQVRKP